ADVRRWLTTRLPRLAGAPVVASAAIHDCRTMSGDLLLDRLPGHPRVWLVGGAAGRAFALAPAIGARAAAHVEDAAREIEPRWALGRLLCGVTVWSFLLPLSSLIARREAAWLLSLAPRGGRRSPPPALSQGARTRQI